ncbi:NERD domain protein [Terrabacter sp. Root85]|nr:NERD domain protein [Terrabacter sp. Root85]
MRLRYAGTCRRCAAPLPAGTRAVYERSSRTVRCLECPGESAKTVTPECDDVGVAVVPDEPRAQPSLQPEPARETSGQAGGSARREFERRRDARERRVRERHPRIGGFLLAITEEPQSTRAWDTGAEGEQFVGGRLDALVGDDLAVLHDRRIPRTRANIDHVVVSRHGIFVVDAKKYKGRPALRVEGGLFRPRTEKLVVGGRDCTKLVDGVLGQVDIVRTAVDDPTVPVTGVLCFVAADWPLIGGAFVTCGVHVLWSQRLVQLVTATPPTRDTASLATVDVAAVRDRLAAAFPPA